MIKVSKGDKVKTRLEQPEIMCSGRERVSYYKWWFVSEITDTAIKLKDQKGEEMTTDLFGISTSGHVIYKVKQK